MLDDKKIKEIKARTPALLAEGLIQKSEEYKKQVGFFKENATDDNMYLDNIFCIIVQLNL